MVSTIATSNRIGVTAYRYLLSLTLCWSSALYAQQSGQWDVLVMPLFYEETFDIEHPAYPMIEKAIEQQLQIQGHAVYSQSALGLNLDCRINDCTPPARSALIEKIRDRNKKTDKSPIDLVWYYEIRESKSNGAAVDQFIFSVASSLVDLETSREIGNWQASPQKIQMTNRARDDTLRSWQAEKVRNYGRQPIDALLTILDDYTRERDFNIELQGFTFREMEAFQAQLVELEGHDERDLESTDSSSTQQLLHSLFSYKFRLRTAMDRRTLEGSIFQILQAAGGGVPATFGRADENAIRLKRASMPYLWAYISSIVALALLLLGVIIWSSYRKHEKTLTYFKNNANANQGVYYLRKNVTLLPHKKSWDAWSENWDRNIDEADNHVQTAELAIKDHDYEKAKDAASLALQTNSDNEAARALRDALPHWQKGYQLFRIAEGEIKDDASAAARRLAEAETLNPHIQTKIDQLREETGRIFRQGNLATNLNKAKEYIDNDRGYAALHCIDEALHDINDLPGFADDINMLNQLRDEASAIIPAASGPMMGQGDVTSVNLITADDVTIGRQTSSSHGDIELSYKRLSRPGKQTRIFRTAGNYAVQDQNSTNGTIVDGRILKSGASQVITKPVKLSMGGSKSADSLGGCQLTLTPAKHSRNSLILRLDQSSLALLDRTVLTEAWPGLDQDVAKTWVLVGESIAVGIHHGKFDLGCQQDSDPVFMLNHESHWQITPAKKGPDSGIKIDGAPLLNIAPLAAGSRVEADGLRFNLQEAS